jgi:hypothetical protein
VNEQLEALPFPSLEETPGPISRAFPREMEIAALSRLNRSRRVLLEGG